MTLSRKIVLHSTALLASLLLLGAASLWSVLGLQKQVRNATKEYAELRGIEQVGAHVAHAIERLSPTSVDTAAALEELRPALAAMEDLAELQQGEAEGSTRHEAMENRGVAQALAALRDVARDVAAGRASPSAPAAAAPDAPGQVAALRRVQQTLRALAHEADVLIAKTQERTRRGVRNALLAIVGAFLLISAVAVGVSISLYRGIMRPLRALRDGARRVARGTFDQRLPAVGEREFVELTEDFNRMAAELEDLYRDLEAKVAEKSRQLVQSERLASVGFLAAGVAHEINNPLGIMSGFAELSLKKLQDPNDPSAPDDARRSLQIIRDEAFRCREITEKLLTMARGGGGRGARRTVNVRGVVDDVAAMVAAHKAYRGTHVQLDVQNGAEMNVTGAEAELRQVLLNLCINALDAVDPVGGVVRIGARRDGSRVELSVEDDGCGMAPDVLAHVFEPFFSARRGGASAPARGTGLGLSITGAIVESLGGTIAATSDGLGRGSRFTVSLPAAPARPGVVAPAAAGAEAITA